MIEKNKEILAFIDEHRDNILNDWQELVELEGATLEKEHVETAMARYRSWLEAEGFECRMIDVGEKTAGTLVGVLGADREGEPILFSGHLDTVYPKGTFGSELFVIKDGHAHGPGVLDMKGGLIIALYVVKALKMLGYEETPLKFVVSGDEENGHQLSIGDDVFIEEAKDCLFGLNMETGRIDNKLCIGRKGTANAYITVTGVGSHAGNDFEAGRNAIAEMAHKIIVIQGLTDLAKGTTVNVGVISGGTVTNAIPASCEIKVDMRFENHQEEEAIKARVFEVASQTYIDGTTTEVEIVSGLRSFETTDKVTHFFEFIQRVASETDHEIPGSVYLGGGSDAAYVGAAETPAICSIGVLGQWNHTKEEYAVVDSMFDRISLVTTLVLNQQAFK